MFAKVTGILLLFIVSGFTHAVSGVVYAQSSQVQPQETYYKAQVMEITSQGETSEYGFTNPYQIVKVKILNGDLNGETRTVVHGKGYNIDKNQLVSKGQMVVISAMADNTGRVNFQIADAYRLDQIATLVILFFAGIIILSGWKGLGAISGMFVSLVIIIRFIIPQMLAGRDPLFISIIGCLVIMVITIYLAHGVSRQTTIALFSTFVTLVGTGLLATFAVHIAHLSGLGNEEAYALKLGPTGVINLRGLLLGGILIGTLGVLDDVTTGLTASVFELSKAGKHLSFTELFRSGMTIGREHISSLVNTLVLAYAGASLPVFLTIIVNPNHVPLWFILNSELLAEEAVRTLSGSIGLVAAVPLTAFLASYYITSASRSHGRI